MESGTYPEEFLKKRQHIFKILVIGDAFAGKTSIIQRYVNRHFGDGRYRVTVGFDFVSKSIDWDPSTFLWLQFWDISSQERVRNMTRAYYREANGAVIVFDLTSERSFEAVNFWKADLDSKIRLRDGSPLPCVLLANKCDLHGELAGDFFGKPSDFGKQLKLMDKCDLLAESTHFTRRQPDLSEKLDAYCRKRGFVRWLQTSAKENVNIDEAIACLVKRMLEDVSRLDEVEWVFVRDSDIVDLTKEAGSTKKLNEKAMCC